MANIQVNERSRGNSEKFGKLATKDPPYPSPEGVCRNQFASSETQQDSLATDLLVKRRGAEQFQHPGLNIPLGNHTSHHYGDENRPHPKAAT
jgi:hypothetical protein